MLIKQHLGQNKNNELSWSELGRICSYSRMCKEAMIGHFSVHTLLRHIAVLRVTLQTWCETPEKGGARLGKVSAGRQKLLSVLKGDDRVHFVDVVRAVPENSSEVVCVRRVVQLYLLAESSVLGERVNLSFVINDLNGTAGYRKIKKIIFNALQEWGLFVVFAKHCQNTQALFTISASL